MTGEQPPHLQLIQMGFGYRTSAMLYAVAKLGVADHLAHGPLTADTLAARTDTQPLALYRTMRALATLGVFSEDAEGRFALTGLGDALRADAPGSARATILFTVGEHHWRAWAELIGVLKDGLPAVEKIYGEAYFDHLAARPEIMSLFSEAMVGIHGQQAPVIARGFDFGRFKRLVDVGGGTGNRLTAILQAHPSLTGVLFDQPHVIAEARARYGAGPLADRLTFVEGNFFDSVPEGGDAVLLSHVLHDWPEAACRTILANVRAAMRPDATLLLIETIVPEAPASAAPGDAAAVAASEDVRRPSAMLDMTMLVQLGGRERTEAEYASLLADAGFRLTGVTATDTPASVIEAELASE